MRYAFNVTQPDGTEVEAIKYFPSLSDMQSAVHDYIISHPEGFWTTLSKSEDGSSTILEKYSKNTINNFVLDDEPTPELTVESFIANPDGIRSHFIAVRQIGCYVAAPGAVVRSNGQKQSISYGRSVPLIYICPMFANGVPDFENLGELEDFEHITIISEALLKHFNAF